MAKLQIDARLIAIEERQAEVVVRAIEAALRVAEVPDERQAEAERAAICHLQAGPRVADQAVRRCERAG